MKALFVGLTGLLFAMPFCLSAQVKGNLPGHSQLSARLERVYPGAGDCRWQMFESTGLNGRSSLRRDNLESGEVLQEKDIPQQFFGEGLTDWGNTLIQLTWKAHTAFVYDRKTFHLVRTFNYRGRAGV